ncbi:U3 small nucleolar RNA-associated protein 14 A [Salvia divinorum]|uniref:U3 small nucleolar RNA-associated protein 14 A n=1 Tax=Salvia divinorum TaxID=28513 RepID=A0ABD1GIL6_SALDI
MAEKGKKEKSRGEITQRRRRDGGEVRGRKRKSLSSSGKRKEEKKRRSGPRLPNALKRELERLNPTVDGEASDGDDEEIDSDAAVGNDVYEYEEGVAEEESTRNKRYDPVENYEFELPEDFEDWKVPSDGEEDDDENEDPGRHGRLLEDITGLSADAFGGKKKKDLIISEAYPECEFNPTGDILDGNGRISIHDLLDPLHGKSGFSKLRKDLHRMGKKTVPTLAPVARTDQERIERKAAYEQSKKDITKWEPLVKRNREAPTLFFDEDKELGYSTIGAIASEFTPRTDFEKKMASLVNQSEVVDAHKRDGARLLELNEVSIEDVKERQERLAKMRDLLFRHEMKAKRVKKIKSKTYHRLLKKDKSKAAEASIRMDPEAAKEHAMKIEFKRAEERMTLKHKNSSKWAKRILKRGLDAQDDSTKAAFSEQLSQHAALTRKINSIKESSSSDDSSDGDDSDDMSAGSDQEAAEKLIKKAKEKTLQILEGDDELPTSGVLALPFMVRGLKKRKEAADEEAKLALEEYESSLKQMGDTSKSRSSDKDAKGAPGGKMVFGAPEKVVNRTTKKEKVNNYYGDSDSESDADANADDNTLNDHTGKSLKEMDIDPSLLREEFGFSHDSVFKSFGDAEDPEPKTAYEVAYLSSDSWKKVRKSSDAVKGSEADLNVRKPGIVAQTENDPESEDDDEDSGTDSEVEMVDGILSSGPKSSYELPSQAELIQRAFAGDDVEEDFIKQKEAVLDEENPEPEKPVLLPGWGQWTGVQKRRGLPSWMLKEHEAAKQKRDESLKKRKDAHLNNVIISEKLGKKAEKLHTKTLPYPYTSKEVFEQSIRMPIGPEFNPVTAIGALNRPEVVKKAGVIIKPIEYEDVSVHERGEGGRKGSAPKQGKVNGKNRSRK